MKRIKGLHRDSNPMDQPAGTYRYSKNMVIDIAKSAIVSEHGDSLKSILSGSSYDIVGYCVLDTSEIVIFSTNGTDSEIGIVNVDTGAYVKKFNDSIIVNAGNLGLSFSVNHPIEAEYKINATDDTSVYFTDDNNVPRFMNLNNPPDDTNAALDIEVIFSLFPVLNKYPKISLDKVVAGGTLNVGTYYITCQLVTQDGATTNVLDISNPIYINPQAEAVASQDFGIGTGYSVNDYSGADPGNTTTKKIIMNVNNLDFQNYQFLRPIVIIQVGGSRSAVSLPDIPITESTKTFSYTGYEEASTFNIADIQIYRTAYTKAKTIAQVDDVLYLGNLVRSRIDLGYQKFANSIKIKSVQLDPNGGQNDVGTGNSEFYGPDNIRGHSSSGIGTLLHDGQPKNTDSGQSFGRSAYDNYYFKGYQRDETYAFYISWILKDGSESIAYHIPGRPVVDQFLQNTVNKREDSDYSLGDSDFYAGNSVTFDAALGANSVKFFHLDTQMSQSPNGLGMGFWENENENYPTAAQDTNNDFQVWTVDALGNSVQVGNIQGQRVRHHHFPAESNQPDPEDLEPNTQNLGSYSRKEIQGGGLIWDGSYAGSTTRCNFNPLGFKAYNIPFPNEIKDLVLGYKIYYANRDSQNATVIDQGMLHNVNPDQNWVLGIFAGVSEAKNLSFDAYHSLITGDSLEGAQLLKPVRHHYVGTGVQIDGNTGWWGKGIQHFTQSADGVNRASGRASRYFVDWTTNRPTSVGGPDGRAAYFFPQSSNIPGGLLTTAIGQGKDFYNSTPIANISYVPGDSVNNNVFGSSFNNIKGTQTIALKLANAYNAQGYFDGSANFSQMFTNPYGINNTVIPTPSALSGAVSGNGNDFPSGTETYTLLDSQLEIVTVTFGLTYGYGGQTEDFRRRNSSQAAIIANLYSPRADIYSNFESQSNLVYTGHLYKTDTLNTATVINPTDLTAEIVMGGDTFLGMVAITKKQKVPWDVINVGSNLTSYNHGATLKLKQVGNVSDRYDYDFATHFFPTESRSHIALREQENAVESSYFFPKSPRNHEFMITGLGGFASTYDFNDDYNAENNIRLLSIFDYDSVVQGIDDYPTRIIRSVKYNQSGITDNFRVFLAGQYRDLPRHRGELWRLESMKSLLVPHMERALMVTRGKEELSVGSVAAALGSGDLFERDPFEVLTTERGEGGTQSQFAGLVTRHGYFFVDINAHKVYMYGETLEEISAYGMSDWFRDNLKHPLSDYVSNYNSDIPTAGVGAISGYDPDLDRILLTFKYVEGSDLLIELLQSNDFNNRAAFNNDLQQFVRILPALSEDGVNGGIQSIPIEWDDATYFTYKYWTISYYPAMKAWGSFHDYNPIFYPYTTKHITKISSGNEIYIPSKSVVPGKYLGSSDLYNIEFEFIDNLEPAITKLFYNINWTIDAKQYGTERITHDPAFSHLYVYNTHQMSRESAITPFGGSFSVAANTRRIERGWQFNDFRDDTLLISLNTLTNTPASKFNIDGMNITQNLGYLDLTKPYHERKKFIDKYLGVRLLDKTGIADRKVIYLYLADTSKRKVYR